MVKNTLPTPTSIPFFAIFLWVAGGLLATFLLFPGSAAGTRTETTANTSVTFTPQDRQSAVIYVYHRIGEDAHPGSSIRLEQFQSHIDLLVHENYNVIPLPELAARLKKGEILPERTVGLSFDGGLRSVLTHAVPLLEKHRLPYTIFVSSARADTDSPSYLSWKDLRRIAKSKLAHIGLHPALYTRLHELPRTEMRAALNRAKSDFRRELGEEPELFSYPFGEYDQAYRNRIAGYGFAAAFGQQSGPAHPGSDMFALPRFSMTEQFGDRERFVLTSRALPIPVSDLEPEDPHISGANPPALGFTLEIPAQGLNCFASGIGKIPVSLVSENRAEIRFSTPLAPGRTRINCTIPETTDAPAQERRWRWLGMLLTVPDVKF